MLNHWNCCWMNFTSISQALQCIWNAIGVSCMVSDGSGGGPDTVVKVESDCSAEKPQKPSEML